MLATIVGRESLRTEYVQAGGARCRLYSLP